MINDVLSSFAECGYDYKQPMTTEQIDDVQRYVFNKTKGEITYGKFQAALYMSGVKIERVKAKKKKQGRCKPVAMMDFSGNVLMTFDSVKEAAHFADKEPSTISAALIKKTCCGGYKWGYVEKEKNENE